MTKMGSPFTKGDIKTRLAKLGKKNVDVIDEMRRRHVECSKSQFTDMIYFRLPATKRTAEIFECADRIISEWEEQAKL